MKQPSFERERERLNCASLINWLRNFVSAASRVVL
jgi:hypothetical protein